MIKNSVFKTPRSICRSGWHQKLMATSLIRDTSLVKFSWGLFSSCCVKLPTNRQINKQTNAELNITPIYLMPLFPLLLLLYLNVICNLLIFLLYRIAMWFVPTTLTQLWLFCFYGHLLVQVFLPWCPVWRCFISTNKFWFDFITSLVIGSK